VVYEFEKKFKNLFFDNFNGVNIKAKKNPINIAVIETTIVMKVAVSNSSPQPLSPKYNSSII
jgi:hypothetical protein